MPHNTYKTKNSLTSAEKKGMDTANPYDLTKIMHYQLSLLRLSTALKTPTPIDLESSRLS